VRWSQPAVSVGSVAAARAWSDGSMQRQYLQHRCSAAASSTDKMAMWRRHKGLRSPMAMAWSSTGDEVSCSEKGSGCAAPRWWKVASTMLNAVGSSPNGVVVVVCSLSDAIESTASSCEKKAGRKITGDLKTMAVVDGSTQPEDNAPAITT
jgi:hypothetical protein